MGFAARLWEPRGASRWMRSGTYALRRLSTSTASAQRGSVASTYRWRKACRTTHMHQQQCGGAHEACFCILALSYPCC